MIYDRENIQISELCPIQFAEPIEKEMYHIQLKYFPKIVSFGFDFQILISEFLYNLAGGLNLVVVDENDNTVSTTPFVLKNLSGAIYYANINILEVIFGGLSNALVQYKVVDTDNNVLAKSVWYIIRPSTVYDIKKIQYSNSENNWNTIFIDGDSVYNFWLDIECGFIPKDSRDEQEIDDFIEQDMTNDTVYGDGYEVAPLTIGDSMGIPNWLRTKTFRAFFCDNVTVDSSEVKRIKGAKMEKVDDCENGLANYKIDVQRPSNYLQQEFTLANSITGVHSIEFNEIYN